MSASVARILSETIFKEETIVVNIAAAMSTPHIGLRRKRSATLSTGMDDLSPSASTTVCNMKSIKKRQAQMRPQERKISP